MKRTNLLAVLCLFPVMTSAFAQTAEPPVPTKPLVHRAPDVASWTITFSRADATPAPAASPDAADIPVSMTVVKSNRIYWEVTTMSSGQKSERWICQGVELMTLPGSDRVGYTRRGEGVAGAFDYSKSDFDGLEWISMENYQGVKISDGKPAFAFAPKPVKPEDKARERRSALLSVPDQLPLSATDEFGTTRTYTYNPPPTAPLVPPDNFRRAFKGFGIDFSAPSPNPQ